MREHFTNRLTNSEIVPIPNEETFEQHILQCFKLSIFSELIGKMPSARGVEKSSSRFKANVQVVSNEAHRFIKNFGAGFVGQI